MSRPRATRTVMVVCSLVLATPLWGQGRPGVARWILAYPGSSKGGSGTTYSVDDFERLLGVVDSTGRIVSRLCTGVIFLQLYAASGRAFTTWIGGSPALGADWSVYLDSIAGSGGALSRLDSAGALVQSATGGTDGPVDVSIMVPYPDSGMDSLVFEGARYALGDVRGQVAAVDAYMRAAKARFALGRYLHLRLHGFYWLHESVSPAEEPLVRAVVAVVHHDGLRLIWIPFYGAPGTSRWHDLGFDEAWLQPNYFFNLTVRSERVDSAAAQAQRDGLGFALEFDANLLRDARYADRLDAYLEVLERVSPARRSVVIYDGQGALVLLSKSAVPRQRALYRRVAGALSW